MSKDKGIDMSDIVGTYTIGEIAGVLRVIDNKIKLHKKKCKNSTKPKNKN